MTYAAIEAGGTKFVCSVGDDQGTILDQVSFPTTEPEETLAQVSDFFRKHAQDLQAIGIGSFGPIDIHPESPTYGYITSTPKLAWQNYNFVGRIKQDFDLPIAWTTDVNAAAYGEFKAGAGQASQSLVYYTIGTGIGGGAIQDGQFVQGFSHPEMGHMLVRSHADDPYSGNCPFHQYCLEGMAAGPAIEDRVGLAGSEIPETDPYWEIEAYYLAQCAYNTSLILRPEKIILGGGVMKQAHLLDRIQRQFQELVNDYIDTPDPSRYIQTPGLEDNAATIGCFELAKDLLK
ncbi:MULTISPECIES: ROK family protein [Aerococcus]|uniref:Fructokinase n=1 Tax=Aerococcus sanguinicola TaxID=119206 RepID=A0A5N1GLI3_9LACT|nr:MULTISPECIES: ROK family protein [Aerococcus]KAA9301254.1 ROK family protein [Aerococcus sanguinicola]MDK6369210.1 ROK family protein [Aerococcus sp. UMB9870]MDK6679034.1 ROK family protein [Aerococcus sp. UMB8608]MDK6687418.1 ROK family protein [Aerococcus sp. UMB8623]MDK6940096.1 ROK family protein [Aerococcus sp. UMB8487]